MKCRRSRIGRRFPSIRDIKITCSYRISTCLLPWQLVLAEDSTVLWNRRKSRKATLILAAAAVYAVDAEKKIVEWFQTSNVKSMSMALTICLWWIEYPSWANVRRLIDYVYAWNSFSILFREWKSLSREFVCVTWWAKDNNNEYPCTRSDYKRKRDCNSWNS